MTDFDKPNPITLDVKAMGVDWGWQNTMAKSLEGKKLMSKWGKINTLKNHLKSIFYSNSGQKN